MKNVKVLLVGLCIMTSLFIAATVMSEESKKADAEEDVWIDESELSGELEGVKKPLYTKEEKERYLKEQSEEVAQEVKERRTREEAIETIEDTQRTTREMQMRMRVPEIR